MRSTGKPLRRDDQVTETLHEWANHTEESEYDGKTMLVVLPHGFQPGDHAVDGFFPEVAVLEPGEWHEPGKRQEQNRDVSEAMSPEPFDLESTSVDTNLPRAVVAAVVFATRKFLLE